MPRSILKLDGMYLEWSSIPDAPITFGMTREEFEQHYLEEYGQHEMSGLPARMKRVEAKGTSVHEDESADDTIWLNRAGPRSVPLSKAEIIEWFCRRKKSPTTKEIAERRATLPKCDPCPMDKDMFCRCFGSKVIDGP